MRETVRSRPHPGVDMASSVTALSSIVKVDQVEAVSISEIVDDATGAKVRAIRIYGQPDGKAGTPVFTLQLASDFATKLLIHTPEQSF